MSEKICYKTLNAELAKKHLMGNDNPNPKHIKEGLKLLDNYTPEIFVLICPITIKTKIRVTFVQHRNKHKDRNSSA